MSTPRRRLIFIGLLVLAGGGAATGYWVRPDWFDAISSYWQAGTRGDMFSRNELPDGFTVSNGRIEATEVDVASRLAERLTHVLAREGDKVEAHAVVARLDTESLEAQLRQAKAEFRRSQQEREHAKAILAQRDSELQFARRELQRVQRLANQGQYASEESVDRARTDVRTAEAAQRAARVQVAATAAAIEAA